MIGIAFEGGGSRGAYHIGVTKALIEAGYEFNGAVGTSIGAINAALFVQGDLKKAEDIWLHMTFAELFDVEEAMMAGLKKAPLSGPSLRFLFEQIGTFFRNRGLDTRTIHGFLSEWIREEDIRRSPMDFGLASLCLSDMRTLRAAKEDIPEGMLVDYLMASSCFPGFRLYKMNGKTYIDGALCDNCPTSLLEKKGYDQIIAVRTHPKDFPARKKKGGAEICCIYPKKSLGGYLSFGEANSRKLIALGYEDGCRWLEDQKVHIGLKY